MAGYRAARTPTEYYAARIPILQRALPEEVLELARTPVDGRRRLPPDEARWLRNLAGEVRAGGPPVRFRTSSPLPTVRVLHGPGEATGVIALFADALERLNLPLAVLLQHLPIAGREIVLLADPTRRAYLDGVPGPVDSLPELASWLGRHAAGRPLWTLGTSMGGGPAVIAGLLTGAVRAAALGGTDPLARPDAGDAADEVRRALADQRDASADARTQVLCVVSERNDRDAARARALMAAIGRGRRVEVAGAERHNVLREAVRAGVLGELLGLLVDPEVPIPPGDGTIVLPRRIPVPSPPRPTASGPVSRSGTPRPRRRDRLARLVVRTLPRGGALRRAAVAAAYRHDVVIG